MPNSPSLRRALLFMPGDSARKIAKAAGMAVDCIVMDLEDGVAFSQKSAARRTVAEALGTLDFGASERLVRINPADGVLALDDLNSTVEGRPDGYVLPKVENVGQVQRVGEFLDREETRLGWPVGGIKLLPIVETALGVVNLPEIARAGPRVAALLFGAEDLAGSMGAQRSAEGWEVFYARSAVVTVAKAYGLDAIDMVTFDLTDVEGFESECRFGRQLGYDGKMVIHPRQVEAAQRFFAPSREEIEQALRVIDAHETHQHSGTGAFVLDGRLVDMPVVRAAQYVVSKAMAAGLLA